jgi:hypothetical protein
MPWYTSTYTEGTVLIVHKCGDNKNIPNPTSPFMMCIRPMLTYVGIKQWYLSKTVILERRECHPVKYYLSKSIKVFGFQYT